MTYLSNKIKTKIQASGLSPSALEKQAGLKPSAVHNILYGRSKNPSIHIIQAIAQTLGCTVSELLQEEQAPINLENDKISTTKQALDKTGKWDQDLYLQSWNMASQFMKKQNKTLSRNKMIEIVEEIYLYSLEEGKNKPNQHFTRWILNKI